jgi:hypothetical protein
MHVFQYLKPSFNLRLASVSLENLSDKEGHRVENQIKKKNFSPLGREEPM